MEPQSRDSSLINSRYPFSVEAVLRAAFAGLILFSVIAGIGGVLAVTPISGEHVQTAADAVILPASDDGVPELPDARLASTEVSYLLSAAKDPDPAVRFQAVMWLHDEHREDPRVVTSLVTALRDTHPAVRSMAASKVGDMGDQRATEGLISLLKDDAQGVVTSAIGSLGDLRDNRATLPLIELLDSEDAYVAQCAILALGRIGDTRAVEPLIRILKDQTSRLRPDAAESLGRLRDRRAIPALIAGLGDADPALRDACANSLRFLPDRRAVVPLIELLDDRDAGVRWSAASALGPIEDRRAIAPLMEAAGDRHAYVRMCAVLSLGHFKDRRVLELLLSTLEYDTDYSVQCAAAGSLGDIGSRHAVPSLLGLLERTRRDAYTYSDLRRSAIWALGRIGDERAVEPLTALIERPTDDMEETLCGHEEATWEVISEALVDIGDERSIRYLMNALRQGNVHVVSGAHRYFIDKGIEGSEALLIRALNEHGGEDMATNFALSGNKRLEEAARLWAKKCHRRIEPNAYIKEHAVRWGSDKTGHQLL